MVAEDLYGKKWHVIADDHSYPCAKLTKTMWGIAKGSSVSWVVKFKGDKTSECTLSKGWSQSYREVKLLFSAGKRVVAILQGDETASLSSMELYDPWISGPLRVS